MQTLEKTKLTLLAHSRNMLNAAQSEDWEGFAALEHDWQKTLETAVAEYGDALNVIGPQLIEDNRLIMECIQRAQQAIAAEMQKNSQAASSVKQYLK